MPAALVDPGTLLCVTLGAEAGVATVEVTMNGLDWSSDGRLTSSDFMK